jgi:AbrB family looped-hinge helix DNA binding protein
MREILSTVTSKGRVTIPAEIRKKLGIDKGDKLSFVITDEGSIELRVPTYSTVASLAGAACSLEQPMDWEKMRDVAREERLAEEHPLSPNRHPGSRSRKSPTSGQVRDDREEVGGITAIQNHGGKPPNRGVLR